MNIYIGNLSPEVSETDLQTAFEKYGKVKSVKVIKDMFTQQSKGFGFIEMLNNAEAQNAIKELNTSEIKGKRIIVNEARPQRNNRGKWGKR
ncbi:MAG: RNA-binding protein [Melioribacteraceae bacterium]|nr:RNA-binding protein [Melioribacteraceae bacterium]